MGVKDNNKEALTFIPLFILLFFCIAASMGSMNYSGYYDWFYALAGIVNLSGVYFIGREIYRKIFKDK